MTKRFYHGSSQPLEIGGRLRPGGGTCGDEAVEALLERTRPTGALARSQAVFMVTEPDEVDAAGGSTDHLYIVRPDREVRAYDMAWVTEAHCKGQGADICPASDAAVSAAGPEVSHFARPVLRAAHDGHTFMPGRSQGMAGRSRNDGPEFLELRPKPLNCSRVTVRARPVRTLLPVAARGRPNGSVGVYATWLSDAMELREEVEDDVRGTRRQILLWQVSRHGYRQQRPSKTRAPISRRDLPPHQRRLRWSMQEIRCIAMRLAASI
jgi:hypothetical protein